jgi:hypothetical protein
MYQHLFLEIKSDKTKFLKRMLFDDGYILYRDNEIIITNEILKISYFCIYILVDFNKNIKLIEKVVESTFIDRLAKAKHFIFITNTNSTLINNHLTFYKICPIPDEIPTSELFQHFMKETESMKNYIQNEINELLLKSPQ